MPISFVDSSRLPTQWGEFTIHAFVDAQTGKEHVALVMGSFDNTSSVLTRIHSECLTGDALFSLRCDCGAQLNKALELIAAEGAGVLVYLRQEGRGIGLANKIRAYHLQDCGADTVEANEQLGFEADARSYSVAKPILEHLSVLNIRLLTNNLRKLSSLEELGFHVTERIPLQTGANPHNQTYIATKTSKLGHLFTRE